MLKQSFVFSVSLTSSSVFAADIGLGDAARYYAEYCANCHGRKLQGNSGPSLIDDDWIHGGEDGDVTRSIVAGYPTKGMPGFGAALTTPEVQALTAIIKEHRAANKAAYIVQPVPTGAQTTSEHRFRLETVATGLVTPWGLAFLPDGRLLVTEKPGRLRVIERGQLLGKPLSGTPVVRDDKEGGLLDVAVHPRYSENGWVYLACVDPQHAGALTHTIIVRGRIREGVWVDQEVIWRPEIKFYEPGGIMYGCRIAFDHEGYLYFSIGARGWPGPEPKTSSMIGEPQDLSRPNGKIHRIHDDGRIPTDNPFVQLPGAYQSIWAYGSRNAQGLAFEQGTDRLWETEHGPMGGDELNLIRRGANYGWPVITYGTNYDGSQITAKTSQAGMEQPVVQWTPSLAVGAIAFYEGKAFPRWKHQILLASLASQELRRLVLGGSQVTGQEVLLKGIGRVRAVTVGSEGFIYLALNSPDVVVRMVPVE